MELVKGMHGFEKTEEDLNRLVERSIYIMREAKAKYEKIGIMASGGKDSTLLIHLAKMAFMGEIPCPVLLLDTTFQFRETYNFLERTSKMLNFKLVHVQNREALMKGMNPNDYDRMECCTKLKTDALREFIEKEGYDALMLGIRWDEHPTRGKDKYFNPHHSPDHVRVHPILHWTERDVWTYIKKNNIPYNPLYDYVLDGNKRYRSIGCWTCTKAIADEEQERGGRAKDKEEVMERLRVLGYM